MSNHPHPIQSTLNRLPQPFGDQPQAIEGGNADLKWKLEVTQIESLGCRLDRAKFSREQNGTSNRPAASVAEDLCRRVNYLMEPIAVLECDNKRQQAIARSTKLTPCEQGGGYYEIAVTPSEVEIQRFVARKGEPRVKSAFCLTRESLERIANDVADVLNQRGPTRAERYLSRKL